MNGTPLMQGAQRFRVLDSANVTIKPITQKHHEEPNAS
jgi:hypothetical protein